MANVCPHCGAPAHIDRDRNCPACARPLAARRRAARLWKWFGLAGACIGAYQAASGLTGPDASGDAWFVAGYIVGSVLSWGLIGAVVGFLADQVI